MTNKNQDRMSITTKPTARYIQLAKELVYIVSVVDTNVFTKTGKLVGMTQFWHKGR